jgi:hypothetical protein
LAVLALRDIADVPAHVAHSGAISLKIRQIY